MKIYELARDLGVDKEALFFLAKNQGIEAKSIVSTLTSDEEEKLLEALDEVGGVLDPLEEKVEVISQDKAVKVLPKVKQGKKQLLSKFIKKFERNLENYEKVPKKKEPAKVKEVGYQKAKTVYRIVSTSVVILLLVCGVSAIRANMQMVELQKSANTSIKILNDNQTSLFKTVKKLQTKVKTLEEKGKGGEKEVSKPQKKTPSK